jgi:ElaB/YqjD/DUF883 family membrane-anchored ribosome-binding protein
MGEEPDEVKRVDLTVGDLASSDDPAAIRAEIEQTRVEMAETIDALQHKLDPQRIVDEAKQTVHDATVGKVTTMVNTVTDRVSDVGEQVQDQAQQAVMYVRDNPVPALLIGAGITWLLMRSRSGRTSYGGSRYGGPRYGERRYEEPRYKEPRYKESETGWTSGVSDAAASVQQRVTQYGRRAETTLERWLRENPLTVGTVALAAGAIVGLSLPRTQTEDAWMGEARDTLVERAQETAQQAVEKVSDVAEQVQESAGGVRKAAGDVSEQLGGETATRRTRTSGGGARG